MSGSRVVEAVLPERLGRPFRWIAASGWVSNLGDGVVLAAGPLLVASETSDPVLVALAWTLQFLPWLVLGLLAGVVADRVDRVRLVVVADVCRAVVLAVLVTTVLTDRVSIALVLGAVLLLGVGETFADTASGTLVPMAVAPAHLGTANARVMAGTVTLNQLAGPPLGALLFGLDRAWPFTLQVVCVLAGAVLLSRVRLPDGARGRPVAGSAASPASVGSVRRDVAEGLRWLWHHGAVRTLTLAIVSFNVTFGAAWSVLVLYAEQRLDLGHVGFGLLTTAMATGGVLATLGYGRLERHVRLATMMRVGLVVETLTHLVLALTTWPVVALVVMVVFGAHAFVWGTVSTTVRQRAVPAAVQGRVQSVYMIGVTGGIVVGSLVGGAVAARWGVTGPFWFAFVGSAVILALIWGQLDHIAHADQPQVPAARPAAPVPGGEAPRG